MTTVLIRPRRRHWPPGRRRPPWWLRSKGSRAVFAAITVELGLILLVLGLLTLAGQQIIVGFAQLSSNVVAGFQQLMGMLEDSRLNISTDTINQWFSELGSTLQADSDPRPLRGHEVSAPPASNIVTGTVIALFVLLSSSWTESIWLFLAKLFPRRACRPSTGRPQGLDLPGAVRADPGVRGLRGRRGHWPRSVPAARAPALPIGVLVFLASSSPSWCGADRAVAVLVVLWRSAPVSPWPCCWWSWPCSRSSPHCSPW
ncbi:hypothetical protein QJS66_08475 [Kocuria rhizophila]|nr:hypothetical protein QJS66_08475 [Kocuria rhizophila]